MGAIGIKGSIGIRSTIGMGKEKKVPPRHPAPPQRHPPSPSSYGLTGGSTQKVVEGLINE